MKTISTFRETFLHQLQATDYVLLDPIPIREQPKKLDILYRSEDLKGLMDHLSQLADLSNINISSSFQSSKVVLKFKDNVDLVVHFIHKFTHKSLVYLEAEEVMAGKVRGSNGINIPCVEHLFEYWILKNFLDLKGIGRAAFQYFSEFHILVQEDLLDYFNMKYGTSFSNIYQLTDFDEKQRMQIVKNLKNTPTNGFIKKVNVRWHSFIGAMKQARII